MNSKIISFALIFLVLISYAAALGIAPARSVYDFSPNATLEGKLRIITDQTPKKVTLAREGEIGNYVELEKNVLTLTDDETWINFKIHLPSDMNPGERIGGIIVSEDTPDNKDSPEQNNVVYALTAVKHQLIVKAPYPGKYLNGKLFVTNLKVNEPVLFTIALVNWGKENVDNVKATIVVKGPTNQELAVIHTDEIPIEAGKESKLITTWQTENAGSYFVEVTVEYDNKILKLSQAIEVGSLEIEIERIQVNNFKIGQIAKLDIYLRNKWNEPVKVEGRVEVFNKNSIISAFNTVPVDINEKSMSIMNAYWNTEGISTGEYDISVNTSYNGKTTSKLFNSFVSIDKIQFNDLISGQVASKNGNNSGLLLIAILILIAINIALFVFVLKKLKSR